MMRRIAAALLLALAYVIAAGAPASAQCTGAFSAGQICGAASAGPPTANSLSSVVPGVNANVLNTQTTNYTVLTSDCGKTIQLGTGSTGYFTLTFPAVAGFPTTCSVVATNGDTGRGKTISGLTGISMLWPGQTLTARIVNGAWDLTGNPGLWLPTSDVTFCIDATSGSDSVDGLTPYSGGSCTTPGQAFLTIQHCIDVVAGQAFWNNVQPTCQVANNASIAQAPILRNYQSSALYQGKQPTIKGDCTTPGNVVIKGASTGAVFTAAANSQAWTVKGFTIAPTASGDYAYFADWFANMNVGSTRITSATAIGIFARYNSAIEIVAEAGCKNWEIAANMGAFVEASQNSTILGQGAAANINMTLTGTPAWSSAFAIAIQQGFVDLQAFAFSGASTGSRYLASTGTVVPAATSLPGNAAGTYVACYSGSTSGTSCVGVPAVAGASNVFTLPATGANESLVSPTSTDTLTNKTISGTQISAATLARSSMASEAQSTIIGRASGAGTGDPTDLTPAQVLTVLGIMTLSTNSLGSDVALNNTANFFDGPSVAQGTTGTWFASGTVTLLDASTATFGCKLWDGTTVIASAGAGVAAGSAYSMSLSGYLASPAGNIRISCRDFTNTTGNIKFNTITNKDSTISVIRVQ